MTWTLIAINIVVFLLEFGASEDTDLVMLRDFALIPAAITGKVTLGGNLPPIFSVFTYMFLHGGWSHIIGNMLFLWVFGDNIEDALGSLRFLFFYLLCGAAGGLAHFAMHPDSVGAADRRVRRGRGRGRRLSDAAALRQDHRAGVRVHAARARLGWVIGFWVLAQVWNVLSAAGRRYRLVGAYRRAAGRRRPDLGVPPPRRDAVRMHAPGRRDRGETGACPATHRRWGSR